MREMPHRGHAVTDWNVVDGSLQITTVRKSAAEDIHGMLSLHPVRANLIKVTMTEGTPPPRQPSLSVSEFQNETGFMVTETANHLVAATDELVIEITKDRCAITYRNRNNELLLREWPEGGKFLERIDVCKTVYDNDSKSEAESTTDGVKFKRSGGGQVKEREGYRFELGFDLQPDEALYGLGQHEEGWLNKRRRLQYLYQQNLKVAMPVLLSTRGYGLFWDTLALSIFDDTGDKTTITVDTADQLQYYFFYGPEFDRIIGELRRLTGPMPMLPRWTYGYLQSKERYETAEELQDVVQRYRDREVPLDAIILDWQSWPGDLWGQKSFDPERFPDPGGMMKAIHDMHAHLMISIWPNMSNMGPNHQEFHDAGLLLNNESNYDAFNTDARAMYWRQVNEGLFRYGIDGWWCDSTEPFSPDWGGTLKPDRARLCRMNCDEDRKNLDPALVNGYSLMHSRGIYEGQRQETSQKRVVNLTRSSSVGQGRYGTITWSGDIEARWSRLRKQVADGLSFTAAGDPRWTLDIGAFFVKPGIPWFWDGVFPDGNQDPGYRELYTRWLQMAVFLPFFRSHGTDTAREIWNFGAPGSPFYEAIRKNIELRYRLLPYIYSVAALEVQKGYTGFRNLAFDFRHDPEVYDIDDQFMFGPALLVCPITEPQHYAPGGAQLSDSPRCRRLYLPAGQCWYDFYNHRRYDGGQWMEVAASLDKIPVFVPAGSIIPMGPVKQYADDLPDAPWEMLVFPGRDAQFAIYEDEGDGYGYENGAFVWRDVHWNDTRQELTVGKPQGEFPGFCANREFRRKIVENPRT